MALLQAAEIADNSTRAFLAEGFSLQAQIKQAKAPQSRSFAIAIPEARQKSRLATDFIAPPLPRRQATPDNVMTTRIYCSDI